MEHDFISQKLQIRGDWNKVAEDEYFKELSVFFNKQTARFVWKETPN